MINQEKQMTYKLNSEAKALAIFTVFDDYLTNYVQSDNNGGYCVYECDATDLTDFVRFKLGISDYDAIILI